MILLVLVILLLLLEVYWIIDPFQLPGHTLWYCWSCCGWGSEPRGYCCNVCFGQGFKPKSRRTGMIHKFQTFIYSFGFALW